MASKTVTFLRAVIQDPPHDRGAREGRSAVSASPDYDSDEHWSRGYAEYDGTDCANCQRQRVEKYANGRRVCEKCMWDQEAGDYAYDHHEMNN